MDASSVSVDFKKETGRWNALLELMTPTEVLDGVERGVKAVAVATTPARARTAEGEIFIVFKYFVPYKEGMIVDYDFVRKIVVCRSSTVDVATLLDSNRKILPSKRKLMCTFSLFEHLLQKQQENGHDEPSISRLTSDDVEINRLASRVSSGLTQFGCFSLFRY